jgi:hypothetical protein
MKRFRIYTEDKNRGDIMGTAASWFSSFTVLHGDGMWQGAEESCLVIEVLTHTDHDGFNVKQFCQWIKDYNDQKEVLVTVEEVDVLS